MISPKFATGLQNNNTIYFQYNVCVAPKLDKTHVSEVTHPVVKVHGRPDLILLHEVMVTVILPHHLHAVPLIYFWQNVPEITLAPMEKVCNIPRNPGMCSIIKVNVKRVVQ